MDLQDRLSDKIDEIIAEDGLKLSTRYLDGNKEGIAFQSLPGSNVIETYFDGSERSEIIYELRFITKDAFKADQLLWKISNTITNKIFVETVVSQDDSFSLQKITANSLPSIAGESEKGFVVYIADYTAEIYQESR